MKKISNKWDYLVMLLIIGVTIITVSLYTSYAYVETSASDQNGLTMTTMSLNYKIGNLDTQIPFAPSNCQMEAFSLIIENTTGTSMKYALTHTGNMAVPVYYNGNIHQTAPTSGTIANGETVTLYMYVNNTTNTNQTLNFRVNTGYVHNPVTGSTYTAVTDIEEGVNCDEGGGDTPVTTGTTLADMVINNYSSYDDGKLIKATPDFTVAATSSNPDQSGLFWLGAPSAPTYYFRGVIEDNYVSFADQIWRIVRINPDKSV